MADVLRRITGFTLPVVGAGISWTPAESPAAAASRILSFLEDRRVLFNPMEAEVPEHCVQSVLEIRRYLTTEIGQLDPASPLALNLNGMRAECRAFLDANPTSRWRDQWGHGLQDWMFNQRLGELRRGFGWRIAQLAVTHGLDVPDPLASILPPEPES